MCDGAVVVDERETFGVIGESGRTFRLYLGGGFVSNGVNCAVGMSAGLVEIGYSGGCLSAGDPDADGDLEALVLGAVFRREAALRRVRAAPGAARTQASRSD